MCWCCARLVYILLDGALLLLLGVGGEVGAGQVGAVRDKAKRRHEEEEEACRAESQSVSALRSESEETAALKGPASASLIRQKWKKVRQWQP